ncbi:hypothetical protein [Archangium sp.]
MSPPQAEVMPDALGREGEPTNVTCGSGQSEPYRWAGKIHVPFSR